MNLVPFWVITLAGRYYCSPDWSPTWSDAYRFYDPNVALAVASQIIGSKVLDSSRKLAYIGGVERN